MATKKKSEIAPVAEEPQATIQTEPPSRYYDDDTTTKEIKEEYSFINKEKPQPIDLKTECLKVLNEYHDLPNSFLPPNLIEIDDHNTQVIMKLKRLLTA